MQAGLKFQCELTLNYNSLNAQSMEQVNQVYKRKLRVRMDLEQTQER